MDGWMAWLSGVRAWLQEPSIVFLLPTASRGEGLWLSLSLLGLVFTSLNLALAVRSRWWHRQYVPGDAVMGEVATAHVEKALGFVLLDVLCVAIGLAALVDAVFYPIVFVFGLLAIRLVLPLLTLRDLLLRRRVFQVQQRQHAALPCQAQEGSPPHG